MLREHLTKGYTLNRQRFEQNARELEATLALVRKAAAGEVLTTDHGRGPVDMIARYTQTFLLLQHYDEGLLAEPKGAPGPVCSEPDGPPATCAIRERSSVFSAIDDRETHREISLTTLVVCLTKSP